MLKTHVLLATVLRGAFLCFALLLCGSHLAVAQDDKPVVRESRHPQEDIIPAHRRETTYVGGKKYGECRGYDDKKRLIFNEFYVEDLQHGDRTLYFPDGKKFSVMPFSRGKFHGKSTGWYSDGTVANTMEWKDGKPHGRQLVYYPNGKPHLEMNHFEGKSHGKFALYSPDGMLAVDGESKDGKSIREQATVAPEATKKWFWLAKIKPFHEYWDARPFVPLFNGIDLRGWHVDVGNAKQFSVQSGIITASARGAGDRNHLLSDKEYANFTIRLEFMVEPGSGGGVVVRALAGDKQSPPIIKVNDPAKFPNYPSGTTNYVSNAKQQDSKPSEDLGPPTGIWHTMEITVRGDACTILLAGKKISEIRLDPKATGPSLPGLKRAKGMVGVQAHTGTVHYRRIEIVELP